MQAVPPKPTWLPCSRRYSTSIGIEQSGPLAAKVLPFLGSIAFKLIPSKLLDFGDRALPNIMSVEVSPFFHPFRSRVLG